MGMASLLMVAALVCAIDQLSKTEARRRVGWAGERRYGPLAIRPTHNRNIGRAPSERAVLLTLWLLALAAAGLLVTSLRTFGEPPARIALGVALGGGAGNLLDLWRHGAVQDFLDLGLGVFNLADVAIVVGLIGTLGLFLFES